MSLSSSLSFLFSLSLCPGLLLRGQHDRAVLPGEARSDGLEDPFFLFRFCFLEREVFCVVKILSLFSRVFFRFLIFRFFRFFLLVLSLFFSLTVIVVQREMRVCFGEQGERRRRHRGGRGGPRSLPGAAFSVSEFSFSAASGMGLAARSLTDRALEVVRPVILVNFLKEKKERERERERERGEFQKNIFSSRPRARSLRKK